MRRTARGGQDGKNPVNYSKFYSIPMPADPFRVLDLGLSDTDLQRFHEHLQATWPGESDFDREVEDAFGPNLDKPRPEPSD